MPFAIETTGPFPSHYPRFGQISSTNGLKLAVRCTDPRNFRDLSDFNQTLSPSGGVQYNPKGLFLSGLDTVNTTALNTDNNFTFIGVLIPTKSNTSQGVRCWLGGTYGAAASAGIGLFLWSESDTVNVGKKRLVLRFSCDGKLIDTGAATNQFYNLTILDNLDTVPLTLKPIFIAVTIDTSNFTASTIGLYCPSLNKSGVQATTNRDHRASQRATFNSPIQVGAVPDNTDTDGAANTRFVPEFLYYNRALTQTEINQQYSLTKQWMASTGAFDLSEWV